MSVIYIVLPMALIFATAAVGAFIWAVRRGQLDDLDTPASRILLDDDAPHERGAETRSHEGVRGRRSGASGPEPR